MLSQKTQQTLDELLALIQERGEIDRRIEALLGGSTPAPQPAPSPEQSAPKHTRRRPESEPEQMPVGKRPSRFTDEQIEQMIRESDSGKSAAQIVSEYGFGSIATWYTIKSNYKKRHQRSTSADLPAYDASDDEETPEEASTERLHIPDNLPAPQKRYSYECTCGYSFKSGIPPMLVKCPDCRRKPKMVEEIAVPS
jgi:hypothetical protein